MSHILSNVFPFLVSVFTHWQIWLSGGGMGGFIVIAATLIERLSSWKLSMRQHINLFLIAFFLCSCFLSWVDKNDELQRVHDDKVLQFDADQFALKTAQNEYGELRADCIYQKGVVDTLSRQNRDQQTSINNCQNQALQRLKPPPPLAFSARVAGMGSFTEQGVKYERAFVIVSTNQVITPAVGTLVCNQDFDVMAWNPTSSLHISIADSIPRETKATFPVRILSPAWTPDNYFVFFTRRIPQGNDIFRCSFRKED